MSYLAQWVSEVKEGETITAADVEVLARVQQCILAADKHHQQARDAQRDAQANVAEKLVVNAAVDLVDSLDHYESHSTTDFNDVRRGRRVNDNLENLRAAVTHLLAVEAAS
jgi:hypothetical protein